MAQNLREPPLPIACNRQPRLMTVGLEYLKCSIEVFLRFLLFADGCQRSSVVQMRHRARHIRQGSPHVQEGDRIAPTNSPRYHVAARLSLSDDGLVGGFQRHRERLAEPCSIAS